MNEKGIVAGLLLLGGSFALYSLIRKNEAVEADSYNAGAQVITTRVVDANVTPGVTYNAKVYITNRSKSAGVGVSASLRTTIDAAWGDDLLMGGVNRTDNYAPGELKVFEYTIKPTSVANGGMFSIRVYSPSGTLLASVSEALIYTPPVTVYEAGASLSIA